MANYGPTPMKFTHSSSDGPDFRRKTKRRGGSFMTLVIALAIVVAGFAWFATTAADRTRSEVASAPAVITLHAPLSVSN